MSSTLGGIDAQPPFQWQGDSFRIAAVPTNGGTQQLGNGADLANGGEAGGGRAVGQKPAPLEDVSNAWKHVSNVVQDDWRPVDLQDLLASSVRDTQYSFQPQGWPSTLRARSPMVHEMPGLVVDRYNACRTLCFCGVFPEIRRAWASVDNSLFLWRFDRWNDVPIEYSGEEQAICAVGLAPPRPNVFVEAVQHVLVVCTTVEVVLLGVCCSPAPGGGDASEDVTLQPLPLYGVPSDNVTMTCVTSTPSGRIFLGGADGHVYELLYGATDSWRQRRCSKVCLTGGLRQMLPPFLPALLFGQPQAVVQLEVDSRRQVLYALSQASAIQVFDLGKDGGDKAAKVAEVPDFMAEAGRAAIAGREVFGRAGDKKGATVVRVAVIPPQESSRLHLLAITSDGRRVYFTTSSRRYGGGAVSDPAAVRPQTLRAEIARAAVPQPGSGAAGSAAAARGGTASSRISEVGAAHYAHGVLLLSEGGAGGGRNRLLAASRDNTVPPLGAAIGQHASSSQGLREVMAELEMAVPGETCALAQVEVAGGALPSAASVLMQDELRRQVVQPAPRFVLVSTAGVLEVEKLRPVDVLQALLEERAANKLDSFFALYGPAEGCAMAIQLAASPAGSVPAAVVQAAKQVLDTPRLVGEPRLASDAGDQYGGGSAGRMAAEEQATQQQQASVVPNFNMGAPLPVAEPEWSAAHRGLCLFASRLLHPFWEAPLAVPVKPGSALLRPHLGIDTLQALEERLRMLASFLSEYLSKRGSGTRHAARQGSGAGGGGRAPGGYLNAASLFGGGGPGANGAGLGGGRGGGVLDPGASLVKRQRLGDASAKEAARGLSILALVRRGCEACFLLRVLSESNLTRLASRCSDSTRGRLAALRLRDLVASEEGEALAAQLISVLVSQHMSATGVGVAEDLSAVLQSGCPSYFKEDDKTYYAASSLLQRAEAAHASADREALAMDALGLMLRVTLSVDLGQVLPQLVFLRAFDGVVELTLKKAAAMDPHNVAAGSGREADLARQQRYDSCYSHLLALIKWLIKPQGAEEGEGGGGGGGGALEGQQLSHEERDRYRSIVLQRAAASSDRMFLEVLFSSLINLGARRELLALDSPHLQPYLLQAAGLAGAPPPPIGPLDQEQVRHAVLLARFFVSRGSCRSAADVHQALASRRSGPGGAAVSLEERVDSYQSALLQAKSCGDSELVDRLAGRLNVLQLQQRALMELEGLLLAAQEGEYDGAPLDQLQADVSDLRTEARELDDLYNDYAAKYKLWRLCLEMLNASDYIDEAYVRQLWDIYLRQAYDGAYDGGSGATAHAVLSAACDAVEELGSRFFPNESSFPTTHVCLRLEQMAAGQWPERHDPSDDEGGAMVARAMAAACKGNDEAVLRCYDALLGVRAAEQHGQALHSPLLRTRLLRSLLAALTAAKEKLDASSGSGSGQFGYLGFGGSDRRLAGCLLQAAQRYSVEARRLPGEEAARVAAGFDYIAQQLGQAVGGTSWQ